MLSVDTLVYTPHGSKSLGDIKVGDLVACPDGNFSRVIHAKEKIRQKLYKITFIDGRSVLVTDDHLWLAKKVARKNKHNMEWSIFTTSELIFLVKKIKKSTAKITSNVLIPLIEPFMFTPVTNRYSTRYKIAPYILGALIGDGCLTQSSISFSTADREMVSFLSKACTVTKHKAKNSYGIRNENGLIDALRYYGLLGHRAEGKFIPEHYKVASPAIRTEILQGLLDTDGYVDNRSHIEFTSVSKRLATDVQWLVRSLGGKATMSDKIGTYKNDDGVRVKCQKAYRLNISIKNQYKYFKLSRKINRSMKDYNNGLGELNLRVISIHYSKTADVKSIAIRDPKGLFISGDFITTHI